MDPAIDLNTCQSLRHELQEQLEEAEREEDDNDNNNEEDEDKYRDWIVDEDVIDEEAEQYGAFYEYDGDVPATDDETAEESDSHDSDDEQLIFYQMFQYVLTDYADYTNYYFNYSLYYTNTDDDGGSDYYYGNKNDQEEDDQNDDMEDPDYDGVCYGVLESSFVGNGTTLSLSLENWTDWNSNSLQLELKEVYGVNMNSASDAFWSDGRWYIVFVFTLIGIVFFIMAVLVHTLRIVRFTGGSSTNKRRSKRRSNSTARSSTARSSMIKSKKRNKRQSNQKQLWKQRPDHHGRHPTSNTQNATFSSSMHGNEDSIANDCKRIALLENDDDAFDDEDNGNVTHFDNDVIHAQEGTDHDNFILLEDNVKNGDETYLDDSCIHQKGNVRDTLVNKQRSLGIGGRTFTIPSTNNARDGGRSRSTGTRSVKGVLDAVLLRSPKKNKKNNNMIKQSHSPRRSKFKENKSCTISPPLPPPLPELSATLVTATATNDTLNDSIIGFNNKTSDDEPNDDDTFNDEC